MMEEKVGRLDPWGSDLVKDYEGVMTEFGIQKFAPLLKKMKAPHLYMSRGIIFGHRDFDKYLDAVKKGEKCALLTGMMPTGPLHFGSKMVADEIVVEGADVPEDQLEAVICRHLDLPAPEPKQKGLIGRLFGR